VTGDERLRHRAGIDVVLAPSDALLEVLDQHRADLIVASAAG
jgi:hypothetical protein